MTVSTSNPYNEAQAIKAVNALKAHLATKTPSKPTLFDAADESDLEDGAIGVADPEIAFWLVVTTKKFLSDSKKAKPGRIPLAHPYFTSPSPTFTICLIVKDPPTYYKSLLPLLPYHPTSLTIISPAKLKTKYKSYESRRQLERSHDLFIADDRIVTLLPSLLGKSVYRRSAKVPIPIKLSKIDAPKDKDGSVTAPKAKLEKDAALLKKEIEKVVSGTYFQLSASASQTIKIGIRSQTPEELAENITAALNYLTEEVITGGWSGLRSVHLKAAETVALPIWMTDTLYTKADVLSEEEVKRIELLKSDEGRKERKKELKVKKLEKKKGREERSKGRRNWDSDAESDEDQMYVKRKPKAITDGEQTGKKRKTGEVEEGSTKKAKVVEEAAVEDDGSEDKGVPLPEPVDLAKQVKKLKVGKGKKKAKK